MMGRAKKIAICMSVLMALSLALCVLFDMDTAASENNYFTVVDSEGHIIKSFEGRDGTNYLFLTNQNNMQNITITSSEEFTSVDRDDLTIHIDEKTIVGDFSNNSTVVLTMQDGSTKVITLMQSSLPSMYISLNGTTISDINADKNIKHPGNNLTLTDNDNPANNIINVDDVEIKGRGNTSWYWYDKKPYQIKFKKKTSVLGMPKAKKWVLLSNSSDASMMKNKIAFDVANNMGLSYSPSAEYIDLWVDGEYLGTYLVAEKVELGENRVNLADENAVLMEYDNDFYASEEHYFVEPFNNSHFVLKESANETDLKGFDAFRNAMTNFEKNMYSHRGIYDWRNICKELDAESFARWYIVNEYFQNNESASTGFFMYQDGPVGRIAAGPVWDFDSAMGSGTKGTSDLYIYQHWLINLLLERSEFRNLVHQVYEQSKHVLDGANEKTVALMSRIEDSANMNYIRWDRLGKKDGKGDTFPDTYEEAVSGLNTWLTARENGFSIYSPKQELTADVSSDYATTTLTYATNQDYSSVYFAVWSNENGQDDVKWYQSRKDNSGKWNATVNTIEHASTGMYTVHVYASGGDAQLWPQMASAFYVEDYVNGNVISLHRLYNPNSGEHFYTMNYEEAKWLAGLGWSYEGVGWKAPKTSNTPVYRLYNPNAGDHHYTMDYNEMRWLVGLGWNDEGIGWYSDDNKTTVLYRLYNPNALTGSHHYTQNKFENDWLVSLGWNAEGIAWYGL